MTSKSNTTAARQTRMTAITKALQRAMPQPAMELDHRSPWELLVATILSAQCTDQRVNQVTPALFQRYRKPADYAAAKLPELEQLIRSTGFYKSKAKHLAACGRALDERFNGKVPDQMDDLVTLPGVGRKTANVILGNAFGKPGIVVDTHVKRVANRLGLTHTENPDKIEADLQRLLPETEWIAVSQRLLLHGRYICLARKPQCAHCPIYELCSSKEKGPR